MSSIIKLAARYGSTLLKWINKGCPYRTPERVKELHDICKKCEHFEPGAGFVADSDKCGECGCNLHPRNINQLNKLAMATTRCPLDPPKWTEDVS